MPRDPAEILREDRIRLMHMLQAAQRVVRYYAGSGSCLFNSELKGRGVANPTW